MEDTYGWHPHPWRLHLPSEEVHVWRASVSLLRHAASSLERILSGDEIGMARRFKIPLLRERYTVAHGILRQIVGFYLNVEPNSLVFARKEFGKPFLVHHDWLRFNLSHSNDIVLIALANEHEVGIDVEYIRYDIDVLELAGHAFSDNEMAALRTVPPHLLRRAFFACWTRKEAYLKATGQGLAIPLKAFDVSVSPEQPPALIHQALEPADLGRWSFQDVPPHPDYTGTVVVRGKPEAIRCWQWLPPERFATVALESIAPIVGSTP